MIKSLDTNYWGNQRHNAIHNMDSYLFVMRPIFVITEEIKTDNLENRYQFDLDLWVNDAIQKNIPFNLFRAIIDFILIRANVMSICAIVMHRNISVKKSLILYKVI
jgi:hypothetical protein